MAKEKKYFWLKLKQDFFDNLRMKKLRSIAGGDTYTIIYLKMQLLSLQDEGILYYEHVEDSFEKEIALIINENEDDVKLTISFLLANGLLEQTEENKYELTETKMCIGKETSKAEMMRRLREKRSSENQINGNIVTGVLPEVTKSYPEIEIEKEIDIDKKEKKKKVRFEKPTLEEIKEYIKEKGLNVDGKQFFDYFEEGMWIDSKGQQVKNWKQKLLTWNKYTTPVKAREQEYNKEEYNNLDSLYEN